MALVALRDIAVASVLTAFVSIVSLNIDLPEQIALG
jgi:hypothetical protein